jgi:hypothetical protein
MCAFDEAVKMTVRTRFARFDLLGTEYLPLGVRANTRSVSIAMSGFARIQFNPSGAGEAYMPYRWLYVDADGLRLTRLEREDFGVDFDQLYIRPIGAATLWVTYYEFDPDIYREILRRALP